MKTLKTLMVAALLAAAGTACAHGDGQHKKAGAAKKEQQAWGIAGDAKAVKRTVEIRMADSMRFSPDRVEVRQGETLRFILHNDGRQMHEMVIGTRQVLDEHAAMMMKFPNMEHDEPHMAHVPPGKRGEIVWKFNRSGDFDFACLIAGHYQAGMVGRIKVVPR